jgi:hypothetical protein
VAADRGIPGNRSGPHVYSVSWRGEYVAGTDVMAGEDGRAAELVPVIVVRTEGCVEQSA